MGASNRLLAMEHCPQRFRDGTSTSRIEAGWAQTFLGECLFLTERCAANFSYSSHVEIPPVSLKTINLVYFCLTKEMNFSFCCVQVMHGDTWKNNTQKRLSFSQKNTPFLLFPFAKVSCSTFYPLTHYTLQMWSWYCLRWFICMSPTQNP